MEYKCEICKKSYSSYQSLWIHNKKYHKNDTNKQISENNTIINKCEYCNKQFTRKNNLNYHIKNICKEKNKIKNNNEQFNNELFLIKKEIEQIKNKPSIIKNINNGVINHNKGPVYNFLSKPGCENINILSEKEIQYIIDKELNCIVGLVEVLNFNEKYPENHTFCTTALNDKYISTMNSETLTIEKQRKKDFFDKILVEGINKMKLLYNKLKSKNTTKAIEYKKNIDKLIEFVIVNNKGKKAYIELMNTLTFNKRHITQSTWFQLTNNNLPETTKENIIENNILELKDTKILCKKSIIINIDYSSDDNSSDEDIDLLTIQYKGKNYYLENLNVFEINNDASKGSLYGTYSNGKVKKKEDIIEIEI